MKFFVTKSAESLGLSLDNDGLTAVLALRLVVTALAAGPALALSFALTLAFSLTSSRKTPSRVGFAKTLYLVILYRNHEYCIQ